jgi:glycosyltransferase involved in cell wall biosynthesis
MVGDGPLLPICQNLARAWEIQDKVRFTGAVAHEEVIQLMEASFCFLQHSLTADDGDSEGTPVAILEAGAAALPVVATKHGGINDVVLHGETGFLIDEGDVNGMVLFLNRLASQRDMAEKLGSAARAYVADNFSIEKHISSLQALFADVLEPT